MSPLVLGLLLWGGPDPDTLRVRLVDGLPRPALAAAALGQPMLRIGADRAAVWLVRAGDTVALYAAIRDAEPSPQDELVVSLDVSGDGGAAPGHDDFQWRLRRVLDSSVVNRGRAGRWTPPRDDPDWRLGAEREGGGWSVEAAETEEGWCVALRLDPAFLAGEEGRAPALALRLYDGKPGGWHAWPAARNGAHPTSVEQVPSFWAPLESRAPGAGPR